MPRVAPFSRFAVESGTTFVALPASRRIEDSLVPALPFLNDSHLFPRMVSGGRIEVELPRAWTLRRLSSLGWNHRFDDGLYGYSDKSRDFEVEAIFDEDDQKVVIICTRYEPGDLTLCGSWVEKPPLVPMER